MAVQNASHFYQNVAHSSTNQRIATQNVSSMHAQLRSPSHSSGNGYSNTNPQHSSSSSSSSPQAWPQSPGLMQSPRATPSPLPTSSTCRSPFSPTPMAQNKMISSNMPLNNHISNNPAQGEPHPLQSLQKMVMIDRDTSDSSIPRNSYETVPPNSSSPSSTTVYSEQKTYFNLTEQLNSSEAESPYPTYYNLDQHRLCTPPSPNQLISNVVSYEMPTKLSSPGSSLEDQASINRRENEIAHVANEKLNLESNKRECKLEDDKFKHKPTHMIIKNEPQQSHCNDMSSLSTSYNTQPKAGSESSESYYSTSDSNNPMSNYLNQQHQNWKVNVDNNKSSCTQSSTSSTTTASSSPLPTNPKGYYVEQEANSTSSLIRYSDSAIMPPPTISSSSSSSSTSSSSTSTHAQNQNVYTTLESGSWTTTATTTVSASTPALASNNFQLSPEEQLLMASRKKRGRPFGSRNRPKNGASEDSVESGSEDFKLDDSFSEMNEPIKPVVKQKAKSEVEDIGVNTILSLDVQCDQQLTVGPLFPVFPLPSAKSAKSKKSGGPFVRVEKGKSNKILYSIVNVSKKLEDEKDYKKGKNCNQMEARLASLMRRPTSMLNASKKKMIEISQRLEKSNVQDSSWVCIFCKEPSHHKGLGDLFGPYFITIDKKLSSNLTDTTDNKSMGSSELADRLKGNKNESDKRRRSDNSDSSDKKSSRSGTNTSELTESSEMAKENTTQQQKEIWFHEDCLVWSNGVYLIGNSIRNMEEVVKDCLDTVKLKLYTKFFIIQTNYCLFC